MNIEQKESIICKQEQVTFEKTNALAYRPTDNLIYFIENSKFNPAGPLIKNLYRLDARGNKEFITEIFDNFQIKYTGAAISPDGRFFYAVGHSMITNRTDSISFLQIDLESSSFNASNITLFPKSGKYLGLESLVCHPITGQIIAFDDYSNRLVTIDVEKQLVINDLYPVQSQIDFISGLFFDAFGELFGIGRAPQPPDSGAPTPSKYYKFDSLRGIGVEFGPSIHIDDVCSCPNIVAFEQSIAPSITYPCTEATITYRLGNMSGKIQENVTLKQTFPAQSIILDFVHNPFGGDPGSSIGTNQLNISGLTIPLGGDSIVVKISLGELPLGNHNFQAELQGIEQPYRSGSIVLSDDSRTCELMDPTVLNIVPLYVDLENNQHFFCKDGSVLLDANVSDAITYEWNDGSTNSSLEVFSSGLYFVTVSTDCEFYRDSIFVTEADIGVTLGQDLQIDLGDKVDLKPEIVSTGDIAKIKWFLLPDTTAFQECLSCILLSIDPLENSSYALLVIDQFGCISLDTINIRVNKNYKIHFPNIFSPNGDGLNDVFYPSSKHPVDILSFLVFDRWGNQIFMLENGTTNDPTMGWDGKTNGRDLLPGSYIWKMVLSFKDGTSQSLVGDVFLVK
ncbi:MAG TPA: gliding motility-associated C-terminal domain-containing protein [Saprospiraceae bacterium]|nr:gliding motility-associated C-terminal domain-containing protein [Saprospiraceae bacterium]HPN67904.1 gliding motility-associated C-terminal domain-containing protein [Saprospiraceae bacterium]